MISKIWEFFFLKIFLNGGIYTRKKFKNSPPLFFWSKKLIGHNSQAVCSFLHVSQGKLNSTPGKQEGQHFSS
jgi:hypothetical protein